jgi:uncharacterized protein
MSTTETATGTARFRTRPYEMLIDVDVHPIMRDGIRILLPYMPSEWREEFAALPEMPAPSGVGGPVPYGANMLTVDAIPPDGAPPGTHPEFMVTDLFDRYEVGIGQLIMLEGALAMSSFADPRMQAALSAAFNDWMLDHWVIDARMRYALLVAAEDAELAAAEVRRLGDDPRVCSVHVTPAVGKAMGMRHYHPIYQAALEHGLPVITHTANLAFNMPAESYVETKVNGALAASIHISSLVVQGTFEKYPELKVMIVENGFSWIVPLVWRMDAAWRRNRYELPWLRRWPGEYVQTNVRLSTQPVDDDPDPTEMYRQIEVESTHLADILCYSSDYPHWDNDRAGAVLNKISTEAKRKIFCDNAKAFLRL